MYGAFDSEEGVERIGFGRYPTGDERCENARIGVYRKVSQMFGKRNAERAALGANENCKSGKSYKNA